MSNLFELVLEQYNVSKISLEQNVKATVQDRNNCIKYICGDGYKSIYDVSCAIVKSLQKIS